MRETQGNGKVVVLESSCDSRAGGVQTEGEDGVPWLAAYTRSRHEEKVKSYCEALGVEVFLPCYRTWRRWSDRKKLLSLPLFPSYIFVRHDQKLQPRIVQAPGFLWFVHDRGGAVRVDALELNAIRAALTSGLNLDPIPDIEVGDMAEITCGALRGYRGYLESKDAGGVVLRISAIHGAIRVNLPDPGWIRPIA